MNPNGPPAIGNGPNNSGSHRSAWDKLRYRANTIGSITALFLFLVIAGGVVGYFTAQTKKQPAAKAPSVETLSPSDIAKLNQIGANLGSSSQTLNIGANALFRGTADVVGALTVGGRLNANGPVTLSQLNITGNTAATGLNVGSNLLVTGAATLQSTLTVNNLTTINSNLTVAGTVSAGALTAGTIAVQNITISGPLTISHLVTRGLPPTIAAGGGLGAGGTVSISGNDTAGQVNFNTGTPGGSGVLGTITFRAPYGATVHVLLSAITPGAATTPVYVSRSAGTFQVVSAGAVPSGTTLSYDFFVTQ
jgi:hypothetical protein